MKALTIQIRREIWEHKSLWIAPIAAAGLVLVGSLFGDINIPAQRAPGGMGGLAGMGHPMAVYGTAIGVAAFLTIVGSLVIFAYLLDCLYAERKDRSILFWKSLPVSDARTVLTKFAVAMVVVPVSIWILGAVTHLLASGIMALRDVSFPVERGHGFLSAWAAAQSRLLGALVISALWYAPIAGWLMLASAYARRAPLMVALLPIVVPAVAEKIIFDTVHIGAFFGKRLFAWNLQGFAVFNPERNLLEPLAEPGLWLGLAAAAGMLYIVIRLRRYRDDT